MQGFATADLLPAALVSLEKKVLDAGITECHLQHGTRFYRDGRTPGRKNTCVEIMKDAMLSLPFETMRRYGVAYDMPVGIEIKAGKNWLDLDVVYG